MVKQFATVIGGALFACFVAYFGLDSILGNGDLPNPDSSQDTTANAQTGSNGVPSGTNRDSRTQVTNPGYGTNRSNPAHRSTQTHWQNQNQNGHHWNQQNTGGQNGQQRVQNQPGFKQQIIVGTYNIQVFGSKKISNPQVMSVIVKIARYFDVLAIQELRAVDQTIIPRFVEMLNANGSRYAYRVGPRQGRTSSKEQYVYIWNTQTIDLIQEVWNVPDSQDHFHREPLVATFRCKGPLPQNAFSFSLVNIHTDPHEAKEELNAMADSFRYVQAVQARQNIPEDDVIVLGDLNLSPPKYGRFGALPNMVAVIPAHVKTNTAGKENYDNIVFDRMKTTEFTGQSGVFNLMGQPFHLDATMAKKVSDHFPVWAVFSVYEQRQAIANQRNIRQPR